MASEKEMKINSFISYFRHLNEYIKYEILAVWSMYDNKIENKCTFNFYNEKKLMNIIFLFYEF